MKRRAWLLLATALVITAGCASSTPSAPPSVDVTGNWAGTWVYEASSAGSGTAQLSLTQKGSAVTGQLNIQGGRATSGPVTGTVSGNVLSLQHSQVTASGVVNGDQITGTGNGVLAGKFTLNRRK
jgi:hypothetical protein